MDLERAGMIFPALPPVTQHNANTWLNSSPSWRSTRDLLHLMPIVTLLRKYFAQEMTAVAGVNHDDSCNWKRSLMGVSHLKQCRSFSWLPYTHSTEHLVPVICLWFNLAMMNLCADDWWKVNAFEGSSRGTRLLFSNGNEWNAEPVCIGNSRKGTWICEY